MPEQTACERVGQLRGVTWRWRPDNELGLSGDDMGVIAQEVERVLPGLVERRADGYRVVDYAGLVVELVAAITELDARTTALEATATPTADSSTPSACELVSKLAPGEPGQPHRVRELDRDRAATVFPASVQHDAHGQPQIAHHTLVAPLIEAVKELDARLAAAAAPRRSEQ